jgi:hypothetical protein
MAMDPDAALAEGLGLYRKAKQRRVDISPAAYAAGVYTQHCARHQIRVSVPDKSHRCTLKCDFFHIGACPPTDYRPVAVCTHSRIVHICGDACDHAMLLPRSEGYGCTLTGRPLDRAVKSSHTPFVKSPALRSSQGGIIRMTTGLVSRRSHASKGAILEGCIVKAIELQLIHMLKSKARSTLYHHQVNKVKVIVRKYIRRLRGKYVFADIHTVITRHVHECGAKVAPPLRLHHNGLYPLLARDLAEYFKRLTGIADSVILYTVKEARTFTCCMMYWMSVGHLVIDKSALFVNHTIPEAYMATLGVKCADMSTLTRRFKRVVTEGSSAGMEYVHGVRFRWAPDTATALACAVARELSAVNSAQNGRRNTPSACTGF